MPIISLSETFINAFVEREAWWWDHVEAELCGEFEEDLVWAVRLLEGLQDDDHRLSELMTAENSDTKLVNKVGELHQRICFLYKMWLTAAERSLELAHVFVKQGYKLGNLEAFERAVSEVRWIVDSNSLEAEISPYTEQVAKLQPANPDPARYGY